MKIKYNSNRHFHLYAKHWYKTSNLRDDLIALQAHYCGLDKEDCLLHAAVDRLLTLTYPHIKTENDFVRFTDILRPDKMWHRNKSEFNITLDLAESCLSILALTEAKDIPFKLGPPDPKVLPLKDEYYLSTDILK